MVKKITFEYSVANFLYFSSKFAASIVFINQLEQFQFYFSFVTFVSILNLEIGGNDDGFVVLKSTYFILIVCVCVI